MNIMDENKVHYYYIVNIFVKYEISANSLLSLFVMSSSLFIFYCLSTLNFQLELGKGDAILASVDQKN